MLSKYDKRLQCRVQEMYYNYAEKAGGAYFPKDNCCDMNGIIEIFTNIDKDVQLIATYSGDVEDTLYAKMRGKWTAVGIGRKQIATK